VGDAQRKASGQTSPCVYIAIDMMLAVVLGDGFLAVPPLTALRQQVTTYCLVIPYLLPYTHGHTQYLHVPGVRKAIPVNVHRYRQCRLLKTRQLLIDTRGFTARPTRRTAGPSSAWPLSMLRLQAEYPSPDTRQCHALQSAVVCTVHASASA